MGGGSGGHITPLLAVAAELKKQKPDCQLLYIGEKDGKFFDLAKDKRLIDQTYAVSAGKFRRYNGQSFLSHLFDVKTNLLNARDFFRFAAGMGQAKKLLKQIRPDVVFIKGGFVGVPVGKACAKLGIPYITHDSDTLPGLANRMIAKGAFLHAVGMPKEFYNYPAESTEFVGIPLAQEYEFVTPAKKQQYRNQLKLPSDAQIVFISGGSLGAERLNTYMGMDAQELLTNHPKLYILHQAGKGNTGIYSNLPSELMPRVQVAEFLTDMHLYSGAADVVVTRAGATTIAELALQGKPTILVPNPFLTGGHQLTNATHLNESGAVEVVHEEVLNKDPHALGIAIAALINDTQVQEKLSTQLHNLAQPQAAARLATILLESVDYVHEKQKK